MQEADGDGFDAFRPQPRGNLLYLDGVDGSQDRAVRARALIDGQPQVTRHERRWRVGEHLVGRDADVAPELDDIAETCSA